MGTRLTQSGALIVSESGLFNRSDLDRVQAAGAEAVLVGEALMRQEDIQSGLEQLIGVDGVADLGCLHADLCSDQLIDAEEALDHSPGPQRHFDPHQDVEDRQHASAEQLAIDTHRQLQSLHDQAAQDDENQDG